MHRMFVAVFVLALTIVFGAATCEHSTGPPVGLVLFRSHWVQKVGDYEVDLTGGNGRYTIEAFRNGMDTYIGTYRYAFTYNSGDERWASEFEMSYDGQLFVDDTGARHQVAQLPEGFPVPGTHWVKLNATAIRSRGGRRFEFDSTTGELVQVSRGVSPYPRLVVEPDLVQQCLFDTFCEDLFVITRDADDRIAAIAARDRLATMTWTASGLLGSLQQSGDVQAGRAGFRFEYEDGLLSAIVNPADERTEVSYHNRQVSQIQQVGDGNPTHRFAYGSTRMTGVRRRATAVTDPLGGRRIIAYTDDFRVEAERNALGEMTRWSWSGKEIASRTEPHGDVFGWERSGIGGQLVTETQPSGSVVVTEYLYDGVNDSDHREYPLLHQEDSLGVMQDRSYDANGRLASITDAEGYREEFFYDIFGILAAVSTHAETDPQITTFGGDNWHGRPAWVGFGTSFATVYRDLVYSEAGDLVNGDDRRPEAPGQPGVVENRYDHNRYLSAKDLDFGTPATVTLANRFDGQVVDVTRPYGGNTHFEYDALGRLASRCDVVDGADECSAIGYDLNSNTTSITRADGSGESRSYDAANREIRATYSKPGVADMQLVHHWRDGRLASIEDSAYQMQPDSYSYDLTGEISLIDFHDGKRMETERDLRGRVSEIRLLVPEAGGYATTVTLGWEYDGVGRATHLYEDGSLLERDRYESNRLVERWTANGNTKTWLYATALFGGQLESTATWGPMIWASSVIEREAGLLTLRTDLEGLPGGDIVDLEELYHSTDPFDQSRLGSFVTGWGEDEVFSFAPEITYSYDALGNVEWAYNTSATTYPTSQVTWNAEHNRVVSAVYDGQTIEYVYNAAGEVVERGGLPVVRNAMGAVVGHGLWSAEKDTRGRFVSLNGRRRVFGGLVEADAAGNPTAMDLPRVRIEFSAASNSHFFKYRDFRGNLQRLDDDSGSPVVFYRYDPYGVSDIYGTPPDMPERTFAGGLSTGDGLVLTGVRVLDPACKCYWSNDPVFSSTTQVGYTANPLELWDPTGEQASVFSGPAMIGAGAVVVAAAVAGTGLAAIVAWGLGLSLLAYGIYLTLSG